MVRSTGHHFASAGHVLSACSVICVAGILFVSGATHAQGARQAQRTNRLLEVGQGHADAGNPGSAVGFFREAIQVSPNDPRGYVALAEAYLTIDQVSNALEVTESGLRRRPGDRALGWVHARVLISANDPRADTALARISRRYPRFLPARWVTARRAQAKGNWSIALAMYRALVRFETDDKKRAEARQMVGALLRLTTLDPLVTRCAREPTALERALCDRNR